METETADTPIVTEAMIESLVRHFYGRIRQDPVLAPIFAGKIGQDDATWEPHLRTMMNFWSSVMLTSGRYKGNPVMKHRAISAARPEHFETWLDLFRDSAWAVCPPEIAPQFIDRAERIAESLKLAMFYWQGPSVGQDVRP